MSEETSRKVDSEIRKIVDKGYEKARKVLTEKIDDLHKLAKALLTYETLTGDEIEDLINTFEKGSLAMVKIGKNNSSSTEFFFVTNKIPELDGRYSIFGKITKGIDVLERIKKEDYIKGVQISN